MIVPIVVAVPVDSWRRAVGSVTPIPTLPAGVMLSASVPEVPSMILRFPSVVPSVS